MQIVNVALPKSAVELVAGTGIKLSIANAYISLRGNWRVKYLRIMWVRRDISFILFKNTFPAAVVTPPTPPPPLFTERTAEVLIWTWMESPSLQALPWRVMSRADLWSAASTVRLVSAVRKSNSTVEPGEIKPNLVQYSLWLANFTWHTVYSTSQKSGYTFLFTGKW